MDVLIIVLMKTPIYMRSPIMKDKKNSDLLSYLFLFSVYLFISSFFITIYKILCYLRLFNKIFHYISITCLILCLVKYKIR